MSDTTQLFKKTSFKTYSDQIMAKAKKEVAAHFAASGTADERFQSVLVAKYTVPVPELRESAPKVSNGKVSYSIAYVEGTKSFFDFTPDRKPAIHRPTGVVTDKEVILTIPNSPDKEVLKETCNQKYTEFKSWYYSLSGEAYKFNDELPTYVYDCFRVHLAKRAEEKSLEDFLKN